MKAKVLFLSAVAAIGLCLASCTEKKAETASVEAEPVALTVDALMADPDAFVGDTISLTGDCSHLCKHGGRKAFLVGEDSTMIIRCESTIEMGAPFSPDCIGKLITVRGVVCESRIGEEEIAEMEARKAAADSTVTETCDTERKLQGQGELDTFEARMADYRAKIAERNEAEGKAYLSFFYVQALSYTIDESAATAAE